MKGHKDGRFTYWHDNGKVSMIEEFKEGRKHGTWSEWDTEGKKLAERRYRDGVAVP